MVHINITSKMNNVYISNEQKGSFDQKYSYQKILKIILFNFNSRGSSPKIVDKKFEKMNVIFEEYRNFIFEDVNEGPEEDQASAFAEGFQIADRVTKIKIKIYRYKQEC